MVVFMLSQCLPCHMIQEQTFLLVAGVGHAGGEQQRVDGRLSDEQQKRSVGMKHLPVQVDGATDRHHGGGRCGLAALLVYLQTEQVVSGLSC